MVKAVLFLLLMTIPFKSSLADDDLLQKSIELDKQYLESIVHQLSQTDAEIAQIDATAKEEEARLQADLKRFEAIRKDFVKIIESLQSQKKGGWLSRRINDEDVSNFLDLNFELSGLRQEILDLIKKLRTLYQEAESIVVKRSAISAKLLETTYVTYMGSLTNLNFILRYEGRGRDLSDFGLSESNLLRSSPNVRFHFLRLKREILLEAKNETEKRLEDPLETAFDRFLGKDFTEYNALVGERDLLKEKIEALEKRHELSMTFPKEIAEIRELAIKFKQFRQQKCHDETGFGWIGDRWIEKDRQGGWLYDADEIVRSLEKAKLRAKDVNDIRAQYQLILAKVKKYLRTDAYDSHLYESWFYWYSGTRNPFLGWFVDSHYEPLWENNIEIFIGVIFTENQQKELFESKKALEKLNQSIEDKKKNILETAERGNLSNCKVLFVLTQ